MLAKHLRGSGFEYLGMPYWDWTKSVEIPKLFDEMEIPTPVDRMLEIRHVLTPSIKKNDSHACTTGVRSINNFNIDLCQLWKYPKNRFETSNYPMLGILKREN